MRLERDFGAVRSGLRRFGSVWSPPCAPVSVRFRHCPPADRAGTFVGLPTFEFHSHDDVQTCSLNNAQNLFAYMQGVQLDTERKAEWSQSVRVDAKQQLREVLAVSEGVYPEHWRVM